MARLTRRAEKLREQSAAYSALARAVAKLERDQKRATGKRSETSDGWTEMTELEAWNRIPIVVGLDSDGDIGLLDSNGYSIIIARHEACALLAWLRDFAVPDSDWRPPDDGSIEDGHGSSWSAWCPECRQKTMSIQRPGKVQCRTCG